MNVFRLKPWLIAGSMLACCAGADAAVMLTGAPYSQDFDTLATSGTPTWTNDSTLPGWSLFRQPAPGTAVPTITAGDGSTNSGAFYSFGTGSDSERALGGTGSGGAYFGSPSSGSIAGWIAAAFTNATGQEISSFTLGYDGEQWRNGGNTNAQTTEFQYGFGSTFDSVATWISPGGAFNFVSPIVGASAAALDGNAGANRVAGLGGTISNLSWSDGSTMWARWLEVNDTGNDHGLAIDNVSLSTVSATVPEPTSLVCFLTAVVGLIGLRRKFR
jgi:hypothetical protein